MFENCYKLTNITGLKRFNTSAALGLDEMFQNAKVLTELDLSGFDTTSAKDGEKASTNGHLTATLANMFNTMTCLKKITLGEKFSFVGDGTTTDDTHHAVLPTPNATYIPGATGLWYSEAYPNGQTPAEVAQTHTGMRTYYALATDVPA